VPRARWGWPRWPKSPLLMTSLTKNLPLQAKNFFRVQTKRLAASFETLTGLVALTGPEKFPRKATCVSVFFFWNPQKRPDAKVLYNNLHCLQWWWQQKLRLKNRLNVLSILLNLFHFVNTLEPGVFTFTTCESHFITITLQLHSSAGNWSRELFKPLKDASSLLV